MRNVRRGTPVSKAHFQKVSTYLEATRAEKVLMGGKIASEGFVEPTIVDTWRWARHWRNTGCAAARVGAAAHPWAARAAM
ncbi:hypothetical protein ABS755_07650 [Castellaniella sp. FW104-16D08]|uniref:hypothetical protein n=1 Tax=unclassified Castellaniella TaxID=2617606 RepID=UPI003314EA4A